VEFTIFYAWQSDRPERANRYLIRDAAGDAINELGRDAELADSPRLDHDTAGLSGTPDIANAILKKIEDSGAFIADLTFVGRTDPSDCKKEKLLPNPNVLLEFGYAARSIGWERIISVMNIAYGQPTELIFDLLHRRFPVTYDLLTTDSDSSREARKALTQRLKHAIKAVLENDMRSADDAIRSIDVDCLHLMHDTHGREFSDSQSGDGSIATFRIIRKLTIQRLLDLRLLHADFDPRQNLYAYHWTYKGKLVLAKLGIQ
jgi:hypothetical protein